MGLRELLAEDQRLTILLTLQEADGYRLNEDLLARAASTFALTMGRDDVRAHLSWLERQGLVDVETVPAARGEDLWLATLTRAGIDVCNGRQHPGVKRPGPR